MTKPITKNYLKAFFFSWLHILSPSQKDSRSTKSLAAWQFFCHPLHLEVIIWGNIIRGFAYKQQ